MRVTRIGVICSLLLASAAGLGLALWRCAYRGVEAAGGGTPERQFCESLVEANGMTVLGVLILPVLLAGIGLVAVRRRRRLVLVAVMVALVVFCVLGLASVGLFYLPAAVALVIAVVGWRQVPSPPPAANDPSAGESNWDV
jgi:LPXTG-motif cell wall-anchored protein